VKFEGKTLEGNVINDVFAFLTLYFFLLMMAVFLLSFDPANGQMVTVLSDGGSYTVQHGFFSNFSSALACISNVGPAFEAVGPYASYVLYSDFSKLVLSFVMLMGRLEILPVLLLFARRTWKKI
jgi:trk system potassium uptake protein TrkH